MLESNIRQIAIQAIASRVSGTPAEAAEQILEGISALDFPGRPFVIWPAKLNISEQIEALEHELKRVRHAQQSTADYWAMRESSPQADSGANLESPRTESHAQAFGGQLQEIETHSAPGEAAAEAGLHLSQKPDQEASDASR